MSQTSYKFGSPDRRFSTVFLQHVAGFEVNDVIGKTTFVTTGHLEKDADANPVTLRKVLKGRYKEVASLSGEFLLRNLVIPNLPVGFYGDPAGPPVILGASIDVQEPEFNVHPLEYGRSQSNTVRVDIAPTLGKLARVVCFREPSVGENGLDWLSSDREGCSLSVAGGIIQASINYEKNT